MAQCLRASTDPVEDPCTVPSTHVGGSQMYATNSLVLSLIHPLLSSYAEQCFKNANCTVLLHRFTCSGSQVCVW